MSSMRGIIATLTLLTVLACLPPTAAAQGRRDGPPPKAPQPPSKQAGGLAALAAPLLEPCRRIEFVRMLSAVLGGSHMGPGEGWFGPGRGRRGWNWLRERFDADRDNRISRREFPGSDELFRRLDRDGDGWITAADLDWSEASPFWRQ